MAHTQPRRIKSGFALNRLTVILLVAFVVVGLVTAVLAFVVVRNTIASWNLTNLPGVNVANNGNSSNPAAALTGTPPAGPLQSVEGPPAKAWDGSSRVTILLMGLDYRDWEADAGPSRTDSMMLLTVDPLSKTAGMLSIPRDMWVNIPGFDYGKINQAYFFGEGAKLPGGGPGLAMKTVEEFLGISIDYYAQIDFQTFQDFIDKIGGIEIDVPAEITVDPLGPGNTVTLQPGKQLINGEVALAYARQRETQNGDIDRAGRQQQVALAVFNKLSRPDLLPALIAKAPSLYQSLSSGIHTNLTFNQILQLGMLAAQIPQANIKHAVFGTDTFTFGTSPDGLSILIPIPDKIRIVRDEIFTTGGPLSPAAVSDDPTQLMKAENARVEIQNGTSSAGLATRTATFLQAQGMNVVNTTNSSDLLANTTIYDYSGKPYTLNYLVKTLNVSPNRIFNRYDPNAQVDVVVVLGNDWASNNQLPAGQ